MDIETLADIKLTESEREICEANVRTISVSGSVSINFETFKFEYGGDVPDGLEPIKFTKYLVNQVNWLRQSARHQMSNGGTIGNSLRRTQETN